jgi:hypothetical protein
MRARRRVRLGRTVHTVASQSLASRRVRFSAPLRRPVHPSIGASAALNTPYRSGVPDVQPVRLARLQRNEALDVS